MNIALLSSMVEQQHFGSLLETLSSTLLKLLNARKVSSTEFERHTLVSVDRYIAYAPREDKINTLNDMTKIRKVKLPQNNIPELMSDMDIHIDYRYGLIEYHHINNRLFGRIIINSRLTSGPLDLFKLTRAWCKEGSREMGGTTEFSMIDGDDEVFTKYNRGVEVSTISGSNGTFDKVLAMYGFAIGNVMKTIDDNVDVLIAPRLVRELEVSITKAKETLNKLYALGLTDERMEKDNKDAITSSERLLEKTREDMYKDVTVEEVHFRINQGNAKVQ